MEAVEDLRDVRVLIPRVRRALDGPTATSSASVSSTLTDEQVTNVVADAIAEVAMFTNGAFATLEVAERDSFYQSPIAWRTGEELDEPHAAVVAAQAALNYFHHTLTTSLTSQTISNEGREWSWTISASAVAERLKSLRADRDRLLEAIGASEGVEEWVNTLYIRDRQTDIIIEPWVAGGVGGQEMDWRFNTAM